MVFFVIVVTCASSPWYNLPTLPSMRTISRTNKRSTTSLLPTALASPGVAVLGACAPTPESASRAAAPGSLVFFHVVLSDAHNPVGSFLRPQLRQHPCDGREAAAPASSRETEFVRHAFPMTGLKLRLCSHMSKTVPQILWKSLRFGQAIEENGHAGDFDGLPRRTSAQ